MKWKEKLQLCCCLSESIVKSICRQNAKNHLTVKYWRHNKVYWTNADVWHSIRGIHYLGFMWSNKTIEEFSNWIELSPAYIFGRITRIFHAYNILIHHIRSVWHINSTLLHATKGNGAENGRNSRKNKNRTRIMEKTPKTLKRQFDFFSFVSSISMVVYSVLFLLLSIVFASAISQIYMLCCMVFLVLLWLSRFYY